MIPLRYAMIVTASRCEEVYDELRARTAVLRRNPEVCRGDSLGVMLRSSTSMIKMAIDGDGDHRAPHTNFV